MATPLTLAQWFQTHFTSLEKSTDAKEIEKLFEQTFADHVKITINGAALDRKHFKERIIEQGTSHSSIEVNVNGVVAVPKDKDDQQSGGVAGLFAHEKLFSKFKVHDAPQVTNKSSSLNVVVENLKPAKPPVTDLDWRRIVNFEAVTVSVVAPPHF
ncbi:hypothetical protein AMATHDRAFT_8426 [Amanita thiersii Skay4041]|uniref:Uncharacterized protein n=1 Tax=Amanita thiersii Skay4041 TaxID=703135 RepID=A0A2A9N9L1_9AGAR|nr:hypothetical protein AMATHDRAFT_8426 [Amanita thiersii Skay4041]